MVLHKVLGGRIQGQQVASAMQPYTTGDNRFARQHAKSLRSVEGCDMFRRHILL